MAEFGLRYPCFKRKTASSGVVLGKAVAANLTVNLASGELYGDDVLAEQLSEFSSGSLAMETDNMADEVAHEIYGATVTEGVVTYNKDDSAPEGILGYFKVLMVNKVKKYRAYIYPSVRAALGNDNGQTRGNSITFQTAQTTFTIFADSVTGHWRLTKECASEADAKAFIDQYCGISDQSEPTPPDATLSSLSLGTASLSPEFASGTTVYTAATTNATNTVTAVATDNDATIAITLGENTTVTNGEAATWAEGANTLTIVVTNGTATKTYTVTVTKS